MAYSGNNSGSIQTLAAYNESIAKYLSISIGFSNLIYVSTVKYKRSEVPVNIDAYNLHIRIR